MRYNEVSEILYADTYVNLKNCFNNVILMIFMKIIKL